MIQSLGDIDREVLIAIASGLLGTVAGAFLQGLGSAFQTYREDRRTLKRVLFNQLDLLAQFRAVDISGYLPILLESLEKELLRRGAPKEHVGNLFNGMVPGLVQVLRSARMGDPAKVLQRYQDSVNDLSKVHPLLAHKLSGKADEDFSVVMTQYVERAKEVLGTEEISPNDAEFIDFVTTASQDDLVRRTITSLQKDIFATAQKISFWTRFMVGREMRKFDLRVKNKSDEMAKQLVDTLTMFGLRASANQAPGSESTPPAEGKSEPETEGRNNA